MELYDLGNISGRVHVAEVLGGFPGITRSHTTAF